MVSGSFRRICMPTRMAHRSVKMISQKAPRLVEDVLFLVMAFSDGSTTSNFMQTNSVFYSQGAKCLLDRDYVRLQTEEALHSWAQFMESSNSRLAHLRGISLEMEELTFQASRSVHRIFTDHTQLPRLTTLRILFPESILRSVEDLDMCNVFASISTLETLVLTNMGPVAAVLMRSLQSKLKRVDLNFSLLEVSRWGLVRNYIFEPMMDVRNPSGCELTSRK